MSEVLNNKTIFYIFYKYKKNEMMILNIAPILKNILFY